MRILVAHLYHESNTFSPIATLEEDFEICEGEAMIGKLYGCEVLEEEQVEIVPALYAARWSSGPVDEKAFLHLEDRILQKVAAEMECLDGIYLSMHGAMTVENIGSGEYRTLCDIRRIVGEEMPISVSLDMHANNPSGIENLANILYGYHTAPHVDVRETQHKAVRALLDLVRSRKKTHPAMARVPMLLIGERAITSAEPLKTVFDRCRELEADARLYSATLFVGMAWGDTPYSTVTAVVSPKQEEYREFAEEEAGKLADYLFAHREECAYAHPSYLPHEAVRRALESKNTPLFLSDSGDNPTAGGMGNNTVLLRLMIKAQLQKKRVLFAPIYDHHVVEKLKNLQAGQRIEVYIGMHEDDNSAPVMLDALFLRTGEVFAYHEASYEKMADYVMLRQDHIDVIVVDRQLSFTGMECFETAGVNVSDYDVVVLKMGYIFHELRKACKEMMMALTPGFTPLLITEDQYQHLPRPIWPLDDMGEGGFPC